jgi:ubiquinone/menaquinone biosynthesis C-methylase UbiE
VAQFHFVEDYENLVRQLMAQYPLDEAMSRAVGGDYERVGTIAADILTHAGAKDGIEFLDFGCGSGRVAVALAGRVYLKNYLGTDIVGELLNYARGKCPRHFAFVLHRQYGIPAPDHSFDLACAFSVFTHLLQSETFIYMRDICRTLKPRGKFVFSFLEMADEAQWPIFAATVEAQLHNSLPHLNEFTDRKQIKALAQHAGFKVLEFVSGSDRQWSGEALGQSVAILQKQ